VHDSDVSVPTIPGVSIPGVADDAAILNEAYDSYADALYAYCRSLVQEPAAAADAVRDAFVVAAFRLADVPDESLLRPWLFAAARNECLRAISSAAATGARSIFPDGDEAASADSPAPATGDPAASARDGSGGAGASGDPDDARASALPRAAIGGLDAVERDFILMAWHGLDIVECADVLGIARDEAFKLFSRARDQLEASAGVLVVAGSDWRECAALNTVISGWDGRLTPELRQALRQHIDRCDICADQRRRGLRPSVLLGMSPDAMRGLATTPDTLRRAAWVTTRLKDRVLAAAFDQELASFEHRAMVVRRAAPFRDDGFPVPLDPPGAAPRGKQRSRIPLAVIGLAGTGLVAVLVVVALAVSGQHSTGSGALPTRMSLSQPSATSSGTAPSAEAGSSGHANPGASQSASASPKASASSSAAPSASAKPTGKNSSAPATPRASSPPAPAAPKVDVSPRSLTLNWYPQYGVYGGAITVTNTTSATISWSITLPPDLHIGGFHAQSSGSLSPGQKADVIIYAQRDANKQGGGNNGSRTETVTLHPGNVPVSVTIPGR
jgi:DNA-directed RNA polymerase specialized sigma24 family protein